MRNILTKVIGDKKAWKAMQERAAALPRDYRVVWDEVTSYSFRLSAGDGMQTVAALDEILSLFETGAAQGKSALDVTGPDVAAFCDERLAGTASWLDDLPGTWRDTLNRAVAAKLAE
ncbi:hypothetical protein N802_03610 [Knoellia sinensis KCTC 19936]|uniref:DNA-binding ferritin-like protein (Dps family) n=1 Tax=Knoellia sinensis KCTC 19936 TaxID=1385520 RepID=A0A0A0J2V1_9MICO|nr:DUF1048 domain-containing protein [Knoellia sinensis]KGN31463.1 hypothetical protein N802_03610 [Knoellia sinensis KCTC 19936]